MAKVDLYEELHGILLLALHVANIATILVESFLKGLGAAHRGGFMESTLRQRKGHLLCLGDSLSGLNCVNRKLKWDTEILAMKSHT